MLFIQLLSVHPKTENEKHKNTKKNITEIYIILFDSNNIT